jgi:hypothetical protein
MLKRRWGLLASAAIFAAGSAGAQTAQQADLDKIEQMQRQMQQLQEQMKQVKSDLIEAKKKAAGVKAAESKSEISPAFNGAYGADLKPFPTKAPSVLDKVKLTWGGYFSATTVWREHSTVNDANTTFTAIPYPFSPLYGENEFRASARQSRISLLVEGPLTATQKLSGYFEMDVQGAAPTANFNETNPWTPRLREAFFAYDNLDSGFHFLAGQAWSLVTQTTVDMTPRKENVPMTIDAAFLPGFDYTRNWQVRFVQDVTPWASIGASVEAPAALVFNGSATNGGIANGGTANGWIVNFANPGNGNLNNLVTPGFTADTIPDIIGKVAFDPGWGHYETFGIARFFSDNVYYCPVNDISMAAGTIGQCLLTGAGSSFPGSTSQKTTVGEGVGGSVLLPLIPKYLDVSASTMYGRGIGRYGTSQLSDVYVGANGQLQSITAIHGLVGAIVHPWAGLDIYTYAGIEKEQSGFWINPSGIGGVSGFGVPNVVNAGCYITTAASFTGGASNCAAVNKLVSGVTTGFWQDVYKGPMGRVATGLQWEWIHREGFPGYGVVAVSTTSPTLAGIGAVHTDDNMVLASVRWYPF